METQIICLHYNLVDVKLIATSNQFSTVHLIRSEKITVELRITQWLACKNSVSHIAESVIALTDCRVTFRG